MIFRQRHNVVGSTPEQQASSDISTPAMLLLVLPFYLNDFASIFVGDWRAWLAIDYAGVKLLPLAILWWWARNGRVAPAELGCAVASAWTMTVTFLVVTILGTVIDQNGYHLLAGWPGYAALGGMPPITSRFWDWLDLTAGLLLVGVVEELVFRGAMRHYLGRFTNSQALIVVGSAVLFGLIHWSLGLHAVLVTALIGALFMVAYLATNSLWPIMLAHFAINFIDFAGVVPKSLFVLP